MAMKSPHPIRIGDVEYHRGAEGRIIRVDSEEGLLVRQSSEKDLERMNSLPMLSRTPALTGSSGVPARDQRAMGTASKMAVTGNIDQMIGKRILEQQKKASQQQQLEKDPQERPPSWYDFVVAIFFILFGVLALVAGVFSLLR